MPFIGIDIGTTFIKGALLDADQLSMRHKLRIPFPDRLDLGNALLSEFDPRAILEAIWTTVSQMLAQEPECEGIVMCCQMHGMVLVTEEGETRSNFIAWTDHRGQMQHPSSRGTFVDELFARVDSDARGQLGNELGLERAACFLFWLKNKGSCPQGCGLCRLRIML